MKIPTIREAREYFKNAKTVRVVNAYTIIEVNPALFKKTNIGGINEVINGKFLMTNGDYHCVFCKEVGYAEIITTK